MSREEIIRALREFFEVKELVCDHTFDEWGEHAWQFLDTDYLHALLVIRRDILKAPMICNTSTAHQRGLRCNLCQLVRDKDAIYLSAHVLGKAGDFTVSGMTAHEARELIKKNVDKLPCRIRMEAGVTWLHFDVLPQYGVASYIYEFRAKK